VPSPAPQPQASRRTHRPTPSGAERSFDPEEIIVSKTDVRGVITYANDVFLRVSAYDEADLVGKPHNVVRHPSMPRVVFALLWERIQAGSEVFAYVLNLAADGAHYWVFAHITPTFDAHGTIIGHHSNRRWVPPETRRQVATLYATLLAAERAAGGTHAAVAAGQRALDAYLVDAGVSYDDLVWSLVGDDVAH